MTSRFLHWPIITAYLLPLFLVLVISETNAQPSTPVAVVRPQYASVNGTLYIQGGAPDAVHPVSAFYSLSLTKPWNDTAPLWKTLPTNSSGVLAPTIWMQTMSATADLKHVLIWDFSSPNMSPLFDIKSKTWTNLNLPQVPWAIIHGLWPLIDPASAGLGTFYVPNGCQDSITSYPPVWYMCKLDLTTGDINRNIQMSTQIAGVLYYSFVYCSARNSMMLYGGFKTDTSNVASASPNLYEYNMVANTWSLLTTTGTPPGDINSHCMVQTSDKSKMIVFGGVSIGNLVSSRLYILYLGNLTWVQGADAGTENARYGHACSTNGDSFVAWGGQSSAIMNNTPLIYNIPINQWVHDFVVSGPLPTPITSTSISTLAPTATTTTTTTTTMTHTPSSTPSTDVASYPRSTLSTAGVIGGAAGAVGGVVMIVAIGIFIRKRHKKAKCNAYLLPLPWQNEYMSFQKKRDFDRPSLRDDGYDDGDQDNVSQLQNGDRKDEGETVPYPPSSYLEATSSSSTLVYDQTVPSYQHHVYGDTDSESTSISGAVPRLSSTSGPIVTPRLRHPTFSTISAPSTSSNSIISGVPLSALSLPINIYNRGRATPGPSPLKLSQPIDVYSCDSSDYCLSSAYRQGNPEVLSFYQSPQYVPIGYNGPAVWGNGRQDETRSPQQLGSRHVTSPAAWMSMMYAARSTVDAPYTRRNGGLDVSLSVQSAKPVRTGESAYLQPRQRSRERSTRKSRPYKDGHKEG